MVAAIIVNYHTSRLLPPLLTSLDNEPLVDCVIVADNSQEKELPELLENFGKTRLLVFGGNIGFGAAVNQAAAMAICKYWLVLNPDIRLAEGAVTALVKAAEENGSCLTGPRYYWDERRQFRLLPVTGYSLGFKAVEQAALRFSPDAELVSFQTEANFQRHWNATEPFTEPFLNGACLLVRRNEAYFPDSKIFDERFFMYFEDTDLCTRMILQGEYPLCVPSAEVIHYWDQSPSDRKPEMMAASEEQFLQIHYNAEAPLRNSPVSLPAWVNDLGLCQSPPVFTRPARFPEGKMYLDIGVNHYFRPFARADFHSNSFSFPQDIWNRLSGGTYFCRLLIPGIRRHQLILRWRKA